MTELPTGWVETKFPTVVFFQEGPGLRKHQYRDSGVPFLNIRTFVDGRINRSLCKYLDETEVETKYRHFLVQPDDILIAISGSIGKWAIVRTRDLPLVLNTSIMRFRPLDVRLLERDFLLLFLRSRHFTDQAWGASTGSAQSNVGPSHIRTFKILLPPLPEQRRIVAKIDSLATKSRRARDQLDHIPRLVQKYKQAVLAATFNESAFARWEQGTLGNFVLEGLVGLVRSKEQQSDSTGIPYIRMNHFDMEGVWNDEDLSLVDVSSEELLRYALRKGDVLFNTRNSFELVGKVAVWPANRSAHVYNNNLLRLRFVPRVDAHFAGLLMMSPQFRGYLQSVKSATTSVCAIYQRSLMSAPFAFPPLDEQRSIVKRVSAAISRVDRLASEAVAPRKLIDHLDRAVLARAFQGGLVPQDPDDEPASILLERIRATRQVAHTRPPESAMEKLRER